MLPWVVDTVNMSSKSGADASGTTRPYHHGRLREALVEAATELARTGGPEAIVLRAVSRAAGVSHNAAYRHFADHDELLAAVSVRCMGELAELMATRTNEVRDRQPVARARARLRAIGRAYVEFARTEPGWFRTAFAAAAHTGTTTPPAGPDRPGPYELLGARLDELVEVGVLPAERRPGAESAPWSMVHGFSTLLVEGPLRGIPDADADAMLELVLSVVQRGL